MAFHSTQEGHARVVEPGGPTITFIDVRYEPCSYRPLFRIARSLGISLVGLMIGLFPLGTLFFLLTLDISHSLFVGALVTAFGLSAIAAHFYARQRKSPTELCDPDDGAPASCVRLQLHARRPSSPDDVAECAYEIGMRLVSLRAWGSVVRIADSEWQRVAPFQHWFPALEVPWRGRRSILRYIIALPTIVVIALWILGLGVIWSAYERVPRDWLDVFVGTILIFLLFTYLCIPRHSS